VLLGLCRHRDLPRRHDLDRCGHHDLRGLALWNRDFRVR
jgi:hypothetical protein